MFFLRIINKFKKDFSSGFTLIEMLVVVAIIGILSSVLLTALGPAKNKAKDARIIQEINQIRSLAETLYDGDYDSLEVYPAGSINNPNLKALIDDIASQGGNIVIRKTFPANTYIAYSSLNSTTGSAENPQASYYCVDSAGKSTYTTEDLSTRNACP